MFRILVVDDDRDINRTVCAFLNQSGYEATGCLSANEAYDAMYENVFDLIVSDIMMPKIDGFEFAKTVRSLNNDIPILFMTLRRVRFPAGRSRISEKFFRRKRENFVRNFPPAAVRFKKRKFS